MKNKKTEVTKVVPLTQQEIDIRLGEDTAKYLSGEGIPTELFDYWCERLSGIDGSEEDHEPNHNRMYHAMMMALADWTAFYVASNTYDENEELLEDEKLLKDAQEALDNT